MNKLLIILTLILFTLTSLAVLVPGSQAMKIVSKYNLCDMYANPQTTISGDSKTTCRSKYECDNGGNLNYIVQSCVRVGWNGHQNIAVGYAKITPENLRGVEEYDTYIDLYSNGYAYSNSFPICIPQQKCFLNGYFQSRVIGAVKGHTYKTGVYFHYEEINTFNKYDYIVSSTTF